jgi:hypothetical protein
MRDFRGLHRHGLFVMPNAPDVGSARLQEAGTSTYLDAAIAGSDLDAALEP